MYTESQEGSTLSSLTTNHDNNFYNFWQTHTAGNLQKASIHLF